MRIFWHGALVCPVLGLHAPRTDAQASEPEASHDAESSLIGMLTLRQAGPLVEHHHSRLACSPPSCAGCQVEQVKDAETSSVYRVALWNGVP